VKRPRAPKIGLTERQRMLLNWWRLKDDAQLLEAMQELVQKTRSDPDQFAALPALLAALVRAARPTKRESRIRVDKLSEFLTHVREHCCRASLDKPQMSVASTIKLFAKTSRISQRTLERWYYSNVPECQRLRARVRFVSGKPPGK
jgi:hypothetical protein